MYIKIHVETDAKQEKIKKIADDRYDISIKESPENNQANEKILEIVRHMCPEMIVRIISGHHASAKIISIEPR